MHPPIVSGENLLQAYSNTSKKCPTLKTSRLLESENQNFENTEVKDHLNKVKEFLGKPSVEKTVCLSQAQWIPELKCAKVLKKVGKKWNYFGHRFMGNDVLYPEEAAYLLEISDLELLHTGVPLSLQSGFSLLLNNDTGCTLFEYRVFAHFVTFGFRVFRHDPTLIEEELTPSSKLTEIPDSTSAGSSVEVQVHSNNATKFKTKFTLDLLNDKETWKSFLDKLYHDETSAKVSAEVNENVDQSLSTANENAPPPSNSDILPSGTGDKTEPSNNEPLSDTITVQPSEEPLLKSTEKPSDESSSDKSTEKPSDKISSDKSTEKPTGETSSDRSTEKPSDETSSDTEKPKTSSDKSTEKPSDETSSDKSTEKPSDETASDESTEKTLSEKNTEQSSGPCAIHTVASESSEEAESEDEEEEEEDEESEDSDIIVLDTDSCKQQTPPKFNSIGSSKDVEILTLEEVPSKTIGRKSSKDVEVLTLDSSSEEEKDREENGKNSSKKGRNACRDNVAEDFIALSRNETNAGGDHVPFKRFKTEQSDEEENGNRKRFRPNRGKKRRELAISKSIFKDNLESQGQDEPTDCNRDQVEATISQFVQGAVEQLSQAMTSNLQQLNRGPRGRQFDRDRRNQSGFPPHNQFGPGQCQQSQNFPQNDFNYNGGNPSNFPPFSNPSFQTPMIAAPSATPTPWNQFANPTVPPIMGNDTPPTALTPAFSQLSQLNQMLDGINSNIQRSVSGLYKLKRLQDPNYRPFYRRRTPNQFGNNQFGNRLPNNQMNQNWNQFNNRFNNPNQFNNMNGPNPRFPPYQNYQGNATGQPIMGNYQPGQSIMGNYQPGQSIMGNYQPGNMGPVDQNQFGTFPSGSNNQNSAQSMLENNAGPMNENYARPNVKQEDESEEETSSEEETDDSSSEEEVKPNIGNKNNETNEMTSQATSSQTVRIKKENEQTSTQTPAVTIKKENTHTRFNVESSEESSSSEEEENANTKQVASNNVQVNIKGGNETVNADNKEVDDSSEEESESDDDEDMEGAGDAKTNSILKETAMLADSMKKRTHIRFNVDTSDEENADKPDETQSGDNKNENQNETGDKQIVKRVRDSNISTSDEELERENEKLVFFHSETISLQERQHFINDFSNDPLDILNYLYSVMPSNQRLKLIKLKIRKAFPLKTSTNRQMLRKVMSREQNVLKNRRYKVRKRLLRRAAKKQTSKTYIGTILTAPTTQPCDSSDTDDEMKEELDEEEPRVNSETKEECDGRKSDQSTENDNGSDNAKSSETDKEASNESVLIDKQTLNIMNVSQNTPEKESVDRNRDNAESQSENTGRDVIMSTEHIVSNECDTEDVSAADIISNTPESTSEKPKTQSTSDLESSELSKDKLVSGKELLSKSGKTSEPVIDSMKVSNGHTDSTNSSHAKSSDISESNNVNDMKPIESDEKSLETSSTDLKKVVEKSTTSAVKVIDSTVETTANLVEISTKTVNTSLKPKECTTKTASTTSKNEQEITKNIEETSKFSNEPTAISSENKTDSSSSKQVETFTVGNKNEKSAIEITDVETIVNVEPSVENVDDESKMEVDDENTHHSDEKNVVEKQTTESLLKDKTCNSYESLHNLLNIFTQPPSQQNQDGVEEEGTALKISFDVYCANKNFAKTSRGAPQYRVIVVQPDQELPSPDLMAQLSARYPDSETVPCIFAVVLPGSVQCFRYCDVFIPTLLEDL